MPSQVATTLAPVTVQVIEERVVVEVYDDTGKAATVAAEAPTVVEVGVPGLPGVGTPGLSAYQVALADGFVGTEAEWLASLQGDATAAEAAAAAAAGSAQDAEDAAVAAAASAASAQPQDDTLDALSTGGDLEAAREALGVGAGGIDPANVWECYSDFGSGNAANTSTTLGSEITNLRSGAGTGFVDQDGDDASAGYVTCRLGTTITSNIAVHTDFVAKETAGELYYLFKGSIHSLSDATNSFVAFFGIANALNGEPSFGYFFRYSHDVNGGRLQAIRRALSGSGSDTVVDTGVLMVAGEDHVLKIEANADRSEVKFSVDGTLIANTDGPLLAVNRVNRFGFGAAKSAGSTTIDPISADILHGRLTFATPRY